MPVAVGAKVCVPFVVLTPDQAPRPVQEVALVELQVSVVLCPVVIDVGVTVRVMEGVNGVGVGVEPPYTGSADSELAITKSSI